MLSLEHLSAFGLAFVQHLSVKYIIIGTIVYALLGTMLTFLMTAEIPGIDRSMGDLLSYINPVCWFKGFKGCTQANVVALTGLVLMAVFLIAVYGITMALVGTSGMSLVFKIFPPIPMFIATGTGFVVWLIMYLMRRSENEAVTALGEHEFMGIIVGISTFAIPITYLVMRMVRKKVPQLLERLRGTGPGAEAMLRAEQVRDLIAMKAKHVFQNANLGMAQQALAANEAMLTGAPVPSEPTVRAQVLEKALQTHQDVSQESNTHGADVASALYNTVMDGMTPAQINQAATVAGHVASGDLNQALSTAIDTGLLQHSGQAFQNLANSGALASAVPQLSKFVNSGSGKTMINSLSKFMGSKSGQSLMSGATSLLQNNGGNMGQLGKQFQGLASAVLNHQAA
jgi:hypothetical protein